MLAGQIKDSGGPVGGICLLLGLAAVSVYWPFCAARQRAIDSFSVIVTPTLVVASHEEPGWDCAGARPGKLGPTVVVQGHTIAHAAVGCCACCAPCGAADVQVFLKDPATGERRVNECCGCRCSAGPNVTLCCVKDAHAIVTAIRDGPQRAPPPPPGAVVVVAGQAPATYGAVGPQGNVYAYGGGVPPAMGGAYAYGAGAQQQQQYYPAPQAPPPGYYGGGAKQ